MNGEVCFFRVKNQIEKWGEGYREVGFLRNSGEQDYIYKVNSEIWKIVKALD